MTEKEMAAKKVYVDREESAKKRRNMQELNVNMGLGCPRCLKKVGSWVAKDGKRYMKCRNCGHFAEVIY